MEGASTYVERPPAPGLATLATSVWVQQVGDRPLAQRYVPHGGAEVRCVLGEAPRLYGPLTASAHHPIPPGGTVVGIRLRPGAGRSVARVPADEILDEGVAGADVWRDAERLTDALGDAATPWAALAELQSFLGRHAGPRDALVDEAVRHLMPWRAGTAALPGVLSISERQLRRRCRAAVGVGPKELQRILRFQGFIARIQASVDGGGLGDVDLARWSVDAGYHDQAHLGREARRLAGATPGELLVQYGSACGDGHDHAASYLPMLGPGRPFRTRGASAPALASRS